MKWEINVDVCSSISTGNQEERLLSTGVSVQLLFAYNLNTDTIEWLCGYFLIRYAALCVHFAFQMTPVQTAAQNEPHFLEIEVYVLYSCRKPLVDLARMLQHN